MGSVSSALKLRAANQLNQVGYYSVNSAVEKYPVTTFVLPRIKHTHQCACCILPLLVIQVELISSCLLLSGVMQCSIVFLSGIVPGVSLYDVMWGYSESMAEEILRSSSFLKELWSDHLTQTCYARFMQQEMLYLQRVSSTLEVLNGLKT